MDKITFDRKTSEAYAAVVAKLPSTDSPADLPTAYSIASLLKKELGFCNCDLDNWTPESVTGHSWVCWVHKSALVLARPYNERRAQLKREREQRAEGLLARLHM